MEIVITLGVSALAVAALIGLNILLVKARPENLSRIETAIERLRADNVNFDPGASVVAADGRGALVEETGGARIGLVLATGDRLVTRLLTGKELRAADAGDDGVLLLRLDDFTLPKVRLTLENAETARDWAGRLTRLMA